VVAATAAALGSLAAFDLLALRSLAALHLLALRSLLAASGVAGGRGARVAGRGRSTAARGGAARGFAAAGTAEASFRVGASECEANQRSGSQRHPFHVSVLLRQVFPEAYRSIPVEQTWDWPPGSRE